jgi:hypothetical protein
MIEIRFFVRIRGALTPPPTIEEPVKKIPHAAPTTDNPMHKAIPIFAQAYGETDSRKWPT